MRPEYDFKSGVRGKYAKRHGRDLVVAGERDAIIIERNLKRLNKQARDVISYQVSMSALEKGYMTMSEEGDMEKRSAKGSLRGFKRAMKKVSDVKPGRKDAL